MTDYEYLKSTLRKRNFTIVEDRTLGYYKKVSIEVYEIPRKTRLRICYRFRDGQYKGHRWVDTRTGESQVVKNYPWREMRIYLNHSGLRDASGLLKLKHKV